jgi:predicted nucleotidyltransferase
MKISQNSIEQVAARLGEVAKAQKVILFGSYALGNASEQSDVDFLVISNSTLPRHKRSRQLYALFDEYPFPMDILVYTPQEVETAIRTPGSFLAKVIAEGREVYGGRS